MKKLLLLCALVSGGVYAAEIAPMLAPGVRLTEADEREYFDVLASEDSAKMKKFWDKILSKKSYQGQMAKALSRQ